MAKINCFDDEDEDDDDDDDDDTTLQLYSLLTNY